MDKRIKSTIYFSVIFLGLFTFVTYALTKLPGSLDNACVIGAYLNLENILYNFLATGMISYIISNSLAFGSNKKIKGSMFGIITWATTTFCVPCILPVLSILGISFSLSIFAYTNVWFKILSIGLLAYGCIESRKLLQSKCKNGDCNFTKKL